uniref:uncharacterized protein n=1 Tax=Myxine glutinosa TaxID=7769 RepID=UPI00358E0403
MRTNRMSPEHEPDVIRARTGCHQNTNRMSPEHEGIIGKEGNNRAGICNLAMVVTIACLHFVKDTARHLTDCIMPCTSQVKTRLWICRGIVLVLHAYLIPVIGCSTRGCELCLREILDLLEIHVTIAYCPTWLVILTVIFSHNSAHRCDLHGSLLKTFWCLHLWNMNLGDRGGLNFVSFLMNAAEQHFSWGLAMGQISKLLIITSNKNSKV